MYMFCLCRFILGVKNKHKYQGQRSCRSGSKVKINKDPRERQVGPQQRQVASLITNGNFKDFSCVQFIDRWPRTGFGET